MGLNKAKKDEDVMTLDEFIRFAKKEAGKEFVLTGLDKESYGGIIPCTSASLRNALGIGGFPKRKLVTLDGDMSSGKSTLGYDIIGNCQKIYGDRCLLIDREDSYTKEYGEVLGIDNNKLDIIIPYSLESMYDIIIKALKSNLYGVIMIDSITSFAPESRFDDSVVMGVEARVNSDKMRIVNEALNKSNTLLLMIQQTRERIGVMAGGDPTTVSGGKAIPFYASIRIRITRSKIDRELKQNIMKFTIIKNKLASPYGVGTVVYKWGKGFDFTSEVASLSVDFVIIEKKGNTFYLPELQDFSVVGKKKLLEHLENNEEYVKTVLEPLVLDYLEKGIDIEKDEEDEFDA